MDRMSRMANVGLGFLFVASMAAMAFSGIPAGTEAEFNVPTSPLAMVDEGQRIGFARPELGPLGRAATAQITFPWEERLPGWTIQFVPGNGNIAGFTWSSQQHIEIFVRPGDDAKSLARVLAHELGHAVDVTLNSGDERRAWLEQRTVSTEDWWPTSGRADFSSGAGDFAEAFAYWQLRNTDVRSELAGNPSKGDIALLIQLSRP